MHPGCMGVTGQVLFCTCTRAKCADPTAPRGTVGCSTPVHPGVQWGALPKSASGSTDSCTPLHPGVQWGSAPRCTPGYSGVHTEIGFGLHGRLAVPRGAVGCEPHCTPGCNGVRTPLYPIAPRGTAGYIPPLHPVAPHCTPGCDGGVHPAAPRGTAGCTPPIIPSGSDVQAEYLENPPNGTTPQSSPFCTDLFEDDVRGLLT